jgi:anthranilate synthase component 2
VHLVNELGLQCEVWRNDQFAIEDVDAFDNIILSPGPGIPSEAGLLLQVIEKYAPTKKHIWRLPWSAGYCRSFWR